MKFKSCLKKQYNKVGSYLGDPTGSNKKVQCKQPYLAFTINLHPETDIHLGLCYEDMLPQEQLKYLEKIIVNGYNKFFNSFEDLPEQKYELTVYFEHCKDGRVHAHGWIDFPVTRVNVTNAQKLSTFIYNELSVTGKVMNRKATCAFVKIVDDFDAWFTYCTKDVNSVELKPINYFCQYKKYKNIFSYKNIENVLPV